MRVSLAHRRVINPPAISRKHRRRTMIGGSSRSVRFGCNQRSMNTFVLNDEIPVNRASEKNNWIELRENIRIAREVLERSLKLKTGESACRTIIWAWISFFIIIINKGHMNYVMVTIMARWFLSCSFHFSFPFSLIGKIILIMVLLEWRVILFIFD